MTSISCASCKKECLSELTGTYLLVFFGPASVVVASLLGLSSIPALLFVASAFGLTVFSVILLFGTLSGAHVNPAISVASALSGALDRRLLVPYLAFQVGGAVIAGLSLRLLFSDFPNGSALGSTSLARDVSPVLGVSLEMLGTFLLATSALLAPRLSRRPLRQALQVGATLFILILLIGPLTGASFNPARSLGPSLFSGYFSNQLVYWVGPLLGGIAAGLTFSYVLLKRTTPRGASGGIELDTVCVC